MGNILPLRTKKGIPQPPEHLGPQAASFFLSVVNEYDLEEHHLALLLAAAEALDRAEQARERMRTDGGAVILDRFDQPKEHPAAKVERTSTDTFMKALRELALDVYEPALPGRPPGR